MDPSGEHFPASSDRGRLHSGHACQDQSMLWCSRLASASDGVFTMSNPPSSRRRPSVHITLQRAARLHRLVWHLAESARTRDAILTHLGIGLRTFYRELDLLKRCGVKVRHTAKQYMLL